MGQGWRQGPGIGPDGRFTYGYTWGEMPITPAVQRQVAGRTPTRPTSASRGIGQTIGDVICIAVGLAIVACIVFVVSLIVSAQ